MTAISSAICDGTFDGIAAATCAGGHVVVVDTRLMRVLLIMAGHPQFVQALDAWPVRGAAVASSSGGGGGGGGGSIVTAPDPRIFVTGCDDGCIRKWSELPSPRLTPRFPAISISWQVSLSSFCRCHTQHWHSSQVDIRVARRAACGLWSCARSRDYLAGIVDAFLFCRARLADL